jgi:hypothetical protein
MIFSIIVICYFQRIALPKLAQSGTDVTILKIFSPKNWRFLLKLLLVFAKNLIITLAFEKNAVFKPKIG